MASRLIVDPFVLLRTAPLVSSTCSLWYALDQYHFYGIFNHPDHRSTSKRLLPSYFRISFRSGVVRVLGLLTASLSTAGANLLFDRTRLAKQGSLHWYTAGTIFVASHLLFVPAIAPKVQAIIEESSEGESTSHMDGWLTVHAIRTWTVDLAAWVCFVVGVGRGLWP